MKLLTNAKIFPSLNSESILIDKGKIIFIGDKNKINLSLNDLDIIDCENKSILPGLIDGHCHPLEVISNMGSIDLSEIKFRSADDLKKYLKNTNCKNKKILKFYGFEHRNIKGNLDLKFFDELNLNIPLIIKHRTGHLIFLNSLAIKNLKININDYKFPVDSQKIHQKISNQEQSNFKDNVEKYNKLLMKYGYTTIVDAGVNNDISKFNTYKNLINENKLNLNICYMLGNKNVEQFKEIKSNEKLYIGPTKFIFPEEISMSEIEMILKNHISISKNDLAFHAISSDIIFKILHTLYEKLNKFLGSRLIRLEHATEFLPNTFKVYKDKNLHLIFNPNFIYDHGDFYIKNQEDFDIDSIFNLNDSYKYQFNIGVGTDSPFGSINPINIISSSINRTTKSKNIIGNKNKVDLFEIIKAITYGNAKALKKQNKIGTLKVGKNADIIVLNEEISKSSTIDNLQINHTIINGKTEYARNNNNLIY